MKWQIYAVTRTGTAVNRFHTDVKSVTSGNSLGIGILPLTNLTMAIPAVIITKITARATAKAEVYRKESRRLKLANGANTARVVTRRTKKRAFHQ